MSRATHRPQRAVSSCSTQAGSPRWPSCWIAAVAATSATPAMHREKLLDPELTYSARMLKELLESGQDNGCFGDELASRYREEMLAGNCSTGMSLLCR